MDADVVLEQDVRALGRWLGEALPCTGEVQPASDKRCVPGGGGHAWPCPRRMLGQRLNALDEKRTSPRYVGAGLLRLLPHVRCECPTDEPHRAGCLTWRRLRWEYDFWEKHALTKTFNARRSGEIPLRCFRI